MLPSFHLTCFGYPQLSKNDQLVSLETRKALGLLAYLAASSQFSGESRKPKHTNGRFSPHLSRTELADLFWPELNTADSKRALRRALFVLRRDTAPQLWLADRERIGLDVDSKLLACDLWAFADCIKGAAGHPEDCTCVDCCHCLETAVSLHHAPFLHSFDPAASEAFETWQSVVAQQLQDRLIAGLQRLIAGYRHRNHLAQAIAAAQLWLQLDPLAEKGHRALMALYGHEGNLTAVRRHYAELVTLLQEKVRANPEAETVACYHAILTKPGQPWQLTLVQEARLHGMQMMLRSLLRAKFGDLPPEVILGVEGLQDEEVAIAVAKEVLTAASHHHLTFPNRT
ncbi:MAG: hypothetical protein KC423_12230 [Anaerolineales bacterium]|nr:hypothetical protein [Anaerolineales bacterium]